MNTSLSILPIDWNATFFAALCGVQNHFGFDPQDDGLHFRYLTSDYDAVIAAIDAYPAAYAEQVTKPDLYEQLAEQRRIHIDGFTYNGMVIPMDVESRANLIGCVVGLQRNPDITEIFWKTGPGQHIELTSEAVNGIADAAFRYVQDCFKHEKEVAGLIAAAPDIYALASIDPTAGWPEYPV